MCGRFTHLYNWKQLHRLMRLTTAPQELPLRYNVAPTQDAPVVLTDKGERRLAMLRWGLVPFWADAPGIGGRLINARSESVATAPSFRAAFRKRRCVVPVSGFYEWQKLDGSDESRPKESTESLYAGAILEGESSARGRYRPKSPPKQPWYIHAKDHEPLALAGLWEHWSPKDGGEPLNTFTILTTGPNELMKPIHDRMPVILPPAAFDLWLDPKVQDAAALDPLLAPSPPEALEAYRIGTNVNSPARDDAECIRAA